MLINFWRQLFSSHTISFDPTSPVIEIPVRLQNGKHELFTSFVLDTGATYTVIDDGLVKFLELKPSKKSIELTTASGTEQAGLVTIPKISVAGLTQEDSLAIVTQLPDDAGITGLLGLSFLKQYRFTVDYPKKVIRFSEID